MRSGWYRDGQAGLRVELPAAQRQRRHHAEPHQPDEDRVQALDSRPADQGSGSGTKRRIRVRHLKTDPDPPLKKLVRIWH